MSVWNNGHLYLQVLDYKRYLIDQKMDCHLMHDAGRPFFTCLQMIRLKPMVFEASLDSQSPFIIFVGVYLDCSCVIFFSIRFPEQAHCSNPPAPDISVREWITCSLPSRQSQIKNRIRSVVQRLRLKLPHPRLPPGRIEPLVKILQPLFTVGIIREGRVDSLIPPDFILKFPFDFSRHPDFPVRFPPLPPSA